MPSKKDKRQFKRYRCKSELDLSYKGHTFKAQVIDYSLKGIGFFTNEIASLTSGMNVHFRITDQNLDDDGTIIWAKKEDKFLKSGIERKTISGNLKHYPIADILLDLQRGEMNGILDIKKGPVIKNIYIKDGDMVFATSNSEQDRFIEVLFRTGTITLDQYNQLIEFSKKKKKSYGSSLVELGYLKPEDLAGAVRHHIEEIILSLFEWPDGKFVFLEGPFRSETLIILKLSAANLILEGIKRINNISYIMNVFPPLDTVLYYSTDPINLFQDINLDSTDKDIFNMIDGRRSIREILSLSSMDDFQTIKTIYALISTRIIEFSEKGAPRDTIHEEVLREAESKDDTDFIQKVDDIYNRLESTDYYSILGIEKQAAFETLKKAYYKAAKEFHPDKHLYLSSDTLKNKLDAIFSYLTEAYKVLLNPGLRIEYDRKLSNKPVTAEKNNIHLAKARFDEGSDAFLKGLYDKAEELLGQAVYLDSTAPEYYFYLGLTLEKRKKLHEAAKIFNQAIRLDPVNTNYLAELGHIFLKLGFKLRAKSTFEKTLKINPHNERANEGLQMLENIEQPNG